MSVSLEISTVVEVCATSGGTSGRLDQTTTISSSTIAIFLNMRTYVYKYVCRKTHHPTPNH